MERSSLDDSFRVDRSSLDHSKRKERSNSLDYAYKRENERDLVVTTSYGTERSGLDYWYRVERSTLD